MNSEKQVHSGSIMNGIGHTVVQMNSPEKFHSVYAHVTLVSAL